MTRAKYSVNKKTQDPRPTAQYSDGSSLPVAQ